ncbi:MAG: DUF3309 family protein [Phycisphaerales bacterium]
MSRAVQLVLIVLLVLLVIGLLPVWPYASTWGYFPSGGFGLLLLIALIVLLVDAARGGRGAPRL